MILFVSCCANELVIYVSLGFAYCEMDNKMLLLHCRYFHTSAHFNIYEVKRGEYSWKMSHRPASTMYSHTFRGLGPMPLSIYDPSHEGRGRYRQPCERLAAQKVQAIPSFLSISSGDCAGYV